MNENGSIGYVILGAGLALMTSLFIEVYKIWWLGHSNLKNFKITLRLELKSVVDTIERLTEVYGVKQFFEFKILGELYNKAQRLDGLRDKVIFIKNDVKKIEILSLFNAIGVFQSDVVSLESQAFPNANTSVPASPEQAPPLPWNDQVFSSQRQMLALKSIDIKRRVQDLITYLEK